MDEPAMPVDGEHCLMQRRLYNAHRPLQGKAGNLMGPNADFWFTGGAVPSVEYSIFHVAARLRDRHP
ncbi:MAG TPA: hypothetical protein VFE47_27565, partial [Tepidisphaeraceae bacterium]|nr:hypothetical protein [Tepidisphaeraceae bacterium]